MSQTFRGTCRDCDTENVTLCSRCISHCECYCAEPTYASLGLVCRGCGGEECCCGEE